MLYELYCSQNFILIMKSRGMRWVGKVERMRGRNLYGVLLGKHEGKRTLGRSWRKWE
jgi:hypothetical protein